MAVIWNPSNFPNGIDASTLQLTTDLWMSTTFDTRVSVAEVTLTSAQLLALRATPVALLAAPGAGKVYLLNRVLFKLNWNTTAYTVANTNFALTLGAAGTAVGAVVATPAIMTQTADSLYTMLTPDTLGVSAVANDANKALVIANTGSAEFLAGDSTLSVRIWYETMSV